MADQLLTSSWEFDANGNLVADVDFAGNPRNLNMWEKKVKEDISGTITDIDPNRAPFLRFLELLGSKEDTMNFQFEWLEEDLKPLKATLAGAMPAPVGNISSGVTFNESDVWVPGDVIKVYETGTNIYEMVRVVAKNGPADYDLYRNIFGTGLVTTALGTECLRAGSAFAENTGAPDPDHTSPLHFWNYTQTFKSTVEISGRFKAHEVRGTTDELKRQMNSRMKTHIEGIESAFIFGVRGTDPTGGNRTYTGGFEWFINTFAPAGNNLDMTALGLTFDETFFDRQANIFFRYGSTKKVALVSGDTLSKFSTFAKDYLRINDKASATLGMDVTDFMSPHGTLSLIHSRLLEQTTPTDQKMLVIDPRYVKKRYMKGRDTTLNMNVQPNDQDGIKHEILSDVGLELRLPQAHFVVSNINNIIP